MKIGKNTYYYLTALGIYLILKLFYSYANTNSLAFILKPTNRLIETILNSNSKYLSEIGYYHKDLNILIDKSCSGFNFWIICFLMLLFLSLKFLEKRKFKIIALPLVLMVAYLLTIAVNSSRILFSVLFQNIQAKFTEKEFGWLHQTEGTFIYLSFLILIYLVFEYLFKKIIPNNEKLA